MPRRLTLKLLGYWRGPNSSQDWPSAEDMVDTSWNPEARQLLVDYLHRGLTVFETGGVSMCRFCGVENGSLELTDGVYIWPEGFGHYLEIHGVRPPETFVSHALAKIEALEDVVVDESWWRGIARESRS